MWLTASWRLEGILFERHWKLMSAGWTAKKQKVNETTSLFLKCWHSLVCASVDEFPNMGVWSVRISTFRHTDWNVKWLLLTFDSDMLRRKGKRGFQGYLGCHSLDFEGAAISSQTAGNDIYAQSCTDAWVLMCVFFLFLCEFVCAVLIFRPFLLSRCAFNTLQTLPFVSYTHDLTETLQRAIIVGRRELTVLLPATMR